MNIVFTEHRDGTAKQDTNHPVGCDQPNLAIDVIPEVNHLSPDPVNHLNSPVCNAGCPVRSFPHVPAYAAPSFLLSWREVSYCP